MFARRPLPSCGSPSPSPFTAWLYPTATSYGIIVSEWDAVPGIDQRSWGMDMYSDRRAGLGASPVGTAVGAVGAATVSVLPLNTWTHLVGTYDKTFVRKD